MPGRLRGPGQEGWPSPVHICSHVFPGPKKPLRLNPKPIVVCVATLGASSHARPFLTKKNAKDASLTCKIRGWPLGRPTLWTVQSFAWLCFRYEGTRCACFVRSLLKHWPRFKHWQLKRPSGSSIGESSTNPDSSTADSIAIRALAISAPRPPQHIPRVLCPYHPSQAVENDLKVGLRVFVAQGLFGFWGFLTLYSFRVSDSCGFKGVEAFG